MFLLDLHTFAVTQHASVRMEDVLEEKFGAAHKVLTAFSAATARQRESQSPQQISGQEETAPSSEQKPQEEAEATTPSASNPTREAAKSNKFAEEVGDEHATSEKLIEQTIVSQPPVQTGEHTVSSKPEEIPQSSDKAPTKETYGPGLLC